MLGVTQSKEEEKIIKKKGKLYIAMAYGARNYDTFSCAKLIVLDDPIYIRRLQ